MLPSDGNTLFGTLATRYRSSDAASSSLVASATRDREYIETYCAPLMTVSDFKTNCYVKIGENILRYKKTVKSDKDIAKQMGLSEEVVKELRDCCDPKNLLCPDEEPFMNGDCLPQNLPNDSKLAVHRFLAKENIKPYSNLTKYVKYFDTNTENKDNQGPTQSSHLCKQTASNDEMDDTEVLLTVAIYHPQRRRKDQEFLVVSRQRLTKLRDVIVCQSDHAPTMDCSEDPDRQGPGVKRACDVYKSGYFFIEGVFYNDMRDPRNIDYSKVVMEWAKADQRWQNPRLGIFRNSKMEETTFEDLKFRLGAPYLYCHQGNCEHLMFITDMRIITESDPKKMTNYPVLITRESKLRRICSVCNILTAKWLTRYDELAFEDPSFFCDTCFDYLHYDEEKRKVCQFEAYPYEKKILK